MAERKSVSKKNFFLHEEFKTNHTTKKLDLHLFVLLVGLLVFFVFQLRVLLHQIGIKLFPSHITPKCQFVRVFVDFIKQHDSVKC